VINRLRKKLDSGREPKLVHKVPGNAGLASHGRSIAGSV